MILQDFIDEQKRLLSLERTEEINQSKIISESSPKILEEKNLCIRKLKIANIFTGLFGRTIVEFETQQKSEDSSKRIFTQGDILAICHDSSKSEATKPIATGLFYKLTKDYIQIALDNETDDEVDIRSLEGAILRLVKLSSEVTYQRLKAGLKYLEKRSNPFCGDYLIDLLMGTTNLSSAYPEQEITYFNYNLNDSQREAVRFALSRPDIAIVHGPPGTGKTTVAVEIISQIVLNLQKHKCPKILVCTPSNIALDNLAEKLVKVQFGGRSDKMKNVNVLRLGHSARVMSHLTDLSIDYKLSVCDQAELISQVRSQIDWTLKQSFNKNGKRINKWRELGDLRKELRERELKAVREVLNSSQVIMSTLTGLKSNKSLPLNEIEFDVVIIDEVSQAIETACWLAIPRGKKLILAGDHKQLPPTVLSEEAIKAGLGRSLMERLLDLFPAVETTRMLTCQYRMHEDIMKWSSDTFYDSRLVADESVAHHSLTDICSDQNPDLGPIAPLVFIDTENCDLWELESTQEDSKGNLGESHLAAVYIKYLVDRFQLSALDIGVITPYSRQVQLIKQCLRDKVDFGPGFDMSGIEISTVDGFQGREKEVIITTLVRSNPLGTVGFLSETRRLNVALTRAKRHLCVIGDSATIVRSKDPSLCGLLEYWNQVAEVRSAHEYIYEYDISAGDCVKQIHKPPTKTTKKIVKDSKELEDKLCDQLRKFNLNNAETRLEFPPDLNPRLRALLHELSEQLGLNHASVGEGALRRLVVSKPIIKVKDLEKEVKKDRNMILEKDKSVVLEKEVEKDENVIFEKEVEKDENVIFEKEIEKDENVILERDKDVSKEIFIQKIVIDEISGKTSPKINISKDLEKKKSQYFDTVKTETEERSSPGTEDKTTLSDILRQKSDHLGTILKEKEILSKVRKDKPVKSKKKKVPKVESIEPISDDFDSMIEQFQRMNKECQHIVKCASPVQVLGFDCRFCNKRFCSSHALPEIHQCPRADLSAWRTDAAKVRPTSNKEKVKHAQLSLAMTRKIDEMTAKRAGGSAKKK